MVHGTAWYMVLRGTWYMVLRGTWYCVVHGTWYYVVHGTWYCVVRTESRSEILVTFCLQGSTAAEQSRTQVAGFCFSFFNFPLSSNKAIRWFPSFQVASASFSRNFRFKFTNNKPIALKLHLVKLNCQIMLFMYQTCIALISVYYCHPSNVFIYVLIFISSDQKDERAKRLGTF